MLSWELVLSDKEAKAELNSHAMLYNPGYCKENTEEHATRKRSSGDRERLLEHAERVKGQEENVTHVTPGFQRSVK